MAGQGKKDTAMQMGEGEVTASIGVLKAILQVLVYSGLGALAAIVAMCVVGCGDDR